MARPVRFQARRSPAYWPAAPGRNGRRVRVVIEDADASSCARTTRLLTDAGFAVAVCRGPDGLADGVCPLVHEGRCSLADDADAIVCALRLGRPENFAVLKSLQELGKPVFIEMFDAPRENETQGVVLVPYEDSGAPLVTALRRRFPAP